MIEDNLKENNLKEKRSLFDDASKIREKKAIDYNSSIKLVDYFPKGIDDVLYMIHIKTTRLKSLVENSKCSVGVEYDSIEDTLVDLVNYASFAYDLLNGQMEGQTSNNIFEPNPDPRNNVYVDISKKDHPHGFS